MLTIDLPPLGADPRPRVGLGKVRSRHTEHWLITASTGYTILTSVWDLAVPDEDITGALVAMWDRCVSGDATSPWCYGEAERSPIVQLAELLSDVDLDVDAVVARNRLVPDPGEFGEGRRVDASFGDALRLELTWGTATVSCKPTLGWVMDVHDHLITRRIDLRRLLTGTASQTPGFISDEVETIARAVRLAVDAGAWEPTEGHLPFEIRWQEAPEVHATAWWMRELGYPRTEAYDGKIASTAHVAVWTRQTPISIGDVQRAYARATAEGKKPLLVGVSHFTKSARDWANECNIALFHLWGEDLALSPASRHAEEHMPRVF